MCNDICDNDYRFLLYYRGVKFIFILTILYNNYITLNSEFIIYYNVVVSYNSL